jgi:uncharacterized membrane-anchored protein
MTRPLGAALGDSLSYPQNNYLRPHPIHSPHSPSLSQQEAHPTSRPTVRPTLQSSGAGWLGYGYASLLFIYTIFVLVTWMTIARVDQETDHPH